MLKLNTKNVSFKTQLFYLKQKQKNNCKIITRHLVFSNRDSKHRVKANIISGVY